MGIIISALAVFLATYLGRIISYLTTRYGARIAIASLVITAIGLDVTWFVNASADNFHSATSAVGTFGVHTSQAFQVAEWVANVSAIQGAAVLYFAVVVHLYLLRNFIAVLRLRWSVK